MKTLKLKWQGVKSLQGKIIRKTLDKLNEPSNDEFLKQALWAWTLEPIGTDFKKDFSEIYDTLKKFDNLKIEEHVPPVKKKTMTIFSKGSDG